MLRRKTQNRFSGVRLNFGTKLPCLQRWQFWTQGASQALKTFAVTVSERHISAAEGRMMDQAWKTVCSLRSYRKFIGLILYVLLVSPSAGADMGAKAGVAQNTPSTEDLLRLLIQAAPTKLDQKNEEKGCNSVMPRHGSITVGQYLAFLIAQLESPQKGFVSSRCRVRCERAAILRGVFCCRESAGPVAIRTEIHARS